jgi:hypothetical protein
MLYRARADVVAGWLGVARLLRVDGGDFALVGRVFEFVRQMPVVQLQRELLDKGLRGARLNPEIEGRDLTR